MTFDERYFAIGRLDRLSYGRTVVHCLDPRVKVVVTLLFLVTVVSFPPHEVAALLPFFLFPVLSLTLGGIPAGFILRKILVVSPFALMIGIFNPLLDTRTVAVIAGFPVSAGWISFVSILLKFVLTTGAALLLVATTSFPGICHALRRLGCPSLFVSQLLFLYRSIWTHLCDRGVGGRAGPHEHIVVATEIQPDIGILASLLGFLCGSIESAFQGSHLYLLLRFSDA